MSARKTDDACLLGTKSRSNQCLTLPANEVSIRKNGIEFHSVQAIPAWTEMAISLQMPGGSRKVSCNGVVVACSNGEDKGYVISMLFTNITPQTQSQLSALAR
jgi:hypothetical protein